MLEALVEAERERNRSRCDRQDGKEIAIDLLKKIELKEIYLLSEPDFYCSGIGKVFLFSIFMLPVLLIGLPDLHVWKPHCWVRLWDLRRYDLRSFHDRSAAYDRLAQVQRFEARFAQFRAIEFGVVKINAI